MADRSHLSIGEVLSLLQDDFPDVTISKIRFLESQGLLDPERTPSGYRKFYEGDIERLRWILRHQRDHFLPLKVIKDRLEESAARGLTVPPDEPSGTESPGSQSLFESDQAEAEATEVERDYQPIPVPDRATRSASALAKLANAQVDDLAPPEPSVPAPPPAAPVVPERSAEPVAPVLRAVPDPQAPAPAARVPTAPVVPAAAPAPVAPAAPRPVPPVPAATVSPLDAGPATGSFTLDELGAASGLDAAALAELIKFNLINGRKVGGDTFYDADELVVARQAAGFVNFGIEARHLRMYKVAADREAGFIEQVVMPLLKQRNPTARKQAADNLGELARLGETLRSALLRGALRDHTDLR